MNFVVIRTINIILIAHRQQARLIKFERRSMTNMSKVNLNQCSWQIFHISAHIDGVKECCKNILFVWLRDFILLCFFLTKKILVEANVGHNICTYVVIVEFLIFTVTVILLLCPWKKEDIGNTSPSHPYKKYVFKRVFFLIWLYYAFYIMY